MSKFNVDAELTVKLPYWAVNNLMPHAIEMAGSQFPGKARLGHTLLAALRESGETHLDSLRTKEKDNG